MFRRTLPAAALATGALAIPAQAQSQGGGRLAAIQAAGRIRIGTTGDFNPMSFRDPASREYRGHQIECGQRLARDMNVRAEFVAMSMSCCPSPTAPGPGAGETRKWDAPVPRSTNRHR